MNFLYLKKYILKFVLNVFIAVLGTIVVVGQSDAYYKIFGGNENRFFELN